MLQRQPAVQALQHQHSRARIAAASPTGQQLQSMPLELYGVVSGYSPFVLETPDLLQMQI